LKLAVAYDPSDNKLRVDSYSQAYRAMLRRVISHKGWESVQHITASCSAVHIDADVLVYFDIHSRHAIEIEGIESHRAIKYSYLDDPHQEEFEGLDGNKRPLHKLGAEQRIKRELGRGTRYLICPYPDSYYRFFGPFLGRQAADMLFWYPVCPEAANYPPTCSKPLSERLGKVLANGALVDHHGYYDFRKWAFRQPCVFHIKHWLYNPATPKAGAYPGFLSRFAGALALFRDNAVPKYLEIPLAGCVCFAQWNRQYYEMGFRDGVNCIYVDRHTFADRIAEFLNDPGAYQAIATAGRERVQAHWTAATFADALYAHAKENA